MGVSRLAASSLIVIAAGIVACGGGSDTPPAAGPGPQAAPAPVAGTPPATSTPQADASALPSDVAAIVAGHRQIIVLVEAGPSLGPGLQARTDLAGRLLFQDTHHAVATLGDALAADLATPARARVTAFLEVLERHPELRNADKLAFRDVVADLDEAAAVPASGVPAALRTRLADDDKALDEIEALYSKEIERVFGRFRTRSMEVHREAWSAYVGFLATRFTPQAILEAQKARLDMVLKPGGTPAKAEAPLELSGQRFAANTVALTFDDGPHPKYTDAIRTMLAARNIPAVFFHVGQNVGTVDGKGVITATRAAAASRKLQARGLPARQPQLLARRDADAQRCADRRPDRVDQPHRAHRPRRGADPVPSALRRATRACSPPSNRAT